MAKVTDENGVSKSPEQIASEIITEVNSSALIEISGVRAMELDKIVRYRHAKEIFSKGENFYNKMKEQWRSEAFEKFIESTFRSQEKTIAQQEAKNKLEYFNLLVARGVDKAQAMEMAGL